MICENKQGNQIIVVPRVLHYYFETVWMPCDRLLQAKTIEKVLLGLRKWWPRPLNRGRNYSTSREVIFGTLKTDRLIEGDCFIQVQLQLSPLWAQKKDIGAASQMLLTDNLWQNCWENCVLGEHFSKHHSCTGYSLSSFPWKQCCCVFKRKLDPWAFVGSNIELGEGDFFPQRHGFGNSFVAQESGHDGENFLKQFCSGL